MAKYTTDFVNLISNNLSDRYKAGFPVLKELVQNADDAGASKLVFGYNAGLVGLAQHELLQGPGLWILNNGAFKADDSQAIRSFGVNSKAADTGSIGKFGLGMKSVFHLCEAFFYVAYDGQQTVYEILSPWFQDGESFDMHRQWETDFENNNIGKQDTDVMRSAVSQNHDLSAYESWFFLWIPLRSKKHVPQVEGNVAAPIINKFPAEEVGSDLDFLTEQKIQERIASLLPLLRNLESIELVGTEGHSGFKLELSLDKDSSRLDHLTDQLCSSGIVTNTNTQYENMHFWAEQRLQHKDSIFEQFKESLHWPKSIAIVDGTRKPVPDKAVAEGAVAITHADKRKGRLTVQWAVFLPTEESSSSYTTMNLNSSRDYTFTLHGQFFVDAGRRGIAGIEELATPAAKLADVRNGADMQIAWNKNIAQGLVLPTLLASIASYVVKEKLNDKQITELVQSLRVAALGSGTTKTFFFSTFKNHLCRDSIFVRVLESHGSNWKLLPSNQKLLPLPRPVSSDPSRPWRALSGLKNLGNFVFVDQDSPGLYLAEQNWSADLICQSLKSISKEALSSEKDLGYLISFLETHRNTFVNVELIQNQLVYALRFSLQHSQLHEVRRNRSLFKKLVSMLPANRYFGVGTRNHNAQEALPEEFFHHLLKADSSALLLPFDLIPQDNGKPSRADIEVWLRQLSTLNILSQHERAYLKAAEELIDAVQPKQRSNILERNPRLAILKARDVRAEKDVAVSLEDLISACKSSLLFRITDIKSEHGLVSALAQALPDITPYIVQAKVKDIFESSQSIDLPGNNDSSAIFGSIGKQSIAPKLGSEESRRQLLIHTSSSDLKKTEVRDGVRYILHGNSGKFRASGTLWKDPTGEDSLWVRIWRMVEKDSWNILPVGLSSEIPDKYLKDLDIKPVDRFAVITRLRTGVGLESVSAGLFTDSERNEILGELDTESAWKRIPLHEDQRGEFGPITSSCYLGCEPGLPEKLSHELRFIVESREAKHKKLQNEYTQKWTENRAALEVLRSSEVSKYWSYLLDRLQAIGLSRLDSKALWQDVAWVPLRSSGFIAPNDIINLPSLEADISLLARQHDYIYAGLDDILPDLRTHPAFDTFKSLIPPEINALQMMGLLMQEAKMFVGSNITEDFVIKNKLLLADLQSLPAWRIVEKAIAHANNLNNVTQSLVSGISRQLSTEDSEKVLVELQGNVKATACVQAVFYFYLNEWASSSESVPELTSRLVNIKLLSEDKNWYPPSELVAGLTGVVRASRVDKTVENILQGIIKKDTTGSERTSNSQLVRDLTKGLDCWIEPLEQSDASQAVGALVGLFGDEVREMASRLLSPIAYGDYLRTLNWQEIPSDNDSYQYRNTKVLNRNSASKPSRMAGVKTIDEAFSKIKPMIVNVTESSVHAQSLLGELISVELESNEEISTLFFKTLRLFSDYDVQVWMRPMTLLQSLGLEKQKQILQKTAEDLMGSLGLYNQSSANLTELWRLFDEASQIELELARNLIIDGLPQAFEQLGEIKKQPLIAERMKAIDQAKLQSASAKHTGGNASQALENIEKAIISLEELVTSNKEVQAALLDAIRNKVKGFHYEVSSIPFEILQNADDAVLEYQQMLMAEGKPYFSSADIGHFVVSTSENNLAFIHWGRPINYTGRSSSYRYEYAKDLERMLMLNASSKSSEDGVTGKFGLGFKSVLLASERPRIVSSGLRFEIIAGCLPQKIEHLTASTENLLSKYRKKGLSATAIELPLQQDVNQRELLSSFRRLAGLTTVFFNQIRHIHIDDVIYSWAPDVLIDNDTTGASCEYGSVLLPSAINDDESCPVLGRLLVLRCAKGAIAVPTEGGKFTTFSGGIPAVWVNAPTRGMNAAGVIINAKFEIDTGRSSLPHGAPAKRNVTLAKELADELSPVLAKLIQQTCDDWELWSAKLKLDSSVVTPAEFWNGFWTSLFNKEPDETSSIDTQLINEHVCHLFYKTAQKLKYVPNGLQGGFSRFVEPGKLRIAVPDSRMPALEYISSWEVFLDKYPKDSWCSTKLASWVKRTLLVLDDEVIAKFDQDIVFDVLGAKQKLKPEDVECLSGVISLWSHNAVAGYMKFFEEQAWVRNFSTLQLQAKSGSWKNADELLCEHTEKELIQKFAPIDTFLSPSYTKNIEAWLCIVKYFSFKEPKDSELARWCVLADTNKSKRAVIKWLSENLNNEMLWSQLRTVQYQKSWISELTLEHQLLKGLSAAKRELILEQLDAFSSSENESASNFYDVSADDLDLHKIHNWWAANRNQHLPKYERELWPERINKARLEKTPIDREAWMVLFSLGIFQSIGRVSDAQHRGFLDYLEQRGWWNIISQVEPEEGAEQWMSILKEYTDKTEIDEEFMLWMDSFPRLYRLARWCEDYAEHFYGLQYRTKEQTTHLLTPAEDSNLSGSGFDMPTVRRTLRLGHNLVVRELLRSDVINSDTALTKAFMPSNAVKNFLSDMHYLSLEDLDTSEKIFELLVRELECNEAARFSGDYDIPLIILARNQKLWREVYEWENTDND